MHPRSILCLVLVCCFLGMAGSAAAAQSFAVAPFTMHAPEKYHYLSDGIQSMVTSRLSSETKLQPKDAPQLDKAGGLSRTKARELCKELDLDYLVYGDVTMMQEQSSLSFKILSREGKLITRTSQMSLDKLIPRLDDMIEDVKQELGVGPKEKASAGKTVAEKERVEIEDQQVKEKDPEKLNSRFKQREKVQKDTARNKLNPQFEQTETRQKETNRWRSPELPFSAQRMRVGDANGDGRQEIFLLQEHAVKAFVMRDSGLEHLATFEAGSRIKALTLDLSAPDSDESRKIVVSALRNKRPRSFILSFRGGEFSVVDKEINLLFRVARIPPEYAPRLVGQKLKAPGTFTNGVSLVEEESGKYKLERRLQLPDAANIFNFAYLPQKDEYKVIVADSSTHLRVYDSDGEMEAATEKAYAGSEIRIQKKTSLPGLEDSREDPPSYYFLPTRLIPCNLDADGEFELVVNQSKASYSRFLANQRNYSRGAIHSLYWDGIGLDTAWKTRTVKGSVQDYGLGDIDNDGSLELFICLNTKPQMLSMEGKKTILLAYPLELSKESRQAIFRP
ncbi:MAG: hypothetical protein K9K39_08745 [Desulfohalobiaceae bacterium]|nr:hypothetical protein [Desulfohalobiaceae bacterium]